MKQKKQQRRDSLQNERKYLLTIHQTDQYKEYILKNKPSKQYRNHSIPPQSNSYPEENKRLIVQTQKKERTQTLWREYKLVSVLGDQKGLFSRNKIQVPYDSTIQLGHVAAMFTEKRARESAQVPISRLIHTELGQYSATKKLSFWGN